MSVTVGHPESVNTWTHSLQSEAHMVDSCTKSSHAHFLCTSVEEMSKHVSSNTRQTTLMLRENLVYVTDKHNNVSILSLLIFLILLEETPVHWQLGHLVPVRNQKLRDRIKELKRTRNFLQKRKRNLVKCRGQGVKKQRAGLEWKFGSVWGERSEKDGSSYGHVSKMNRAGGEKFKMFALC